MKLKKALGFILTTTSLILILSLLINTALNNKLNKQNNEKLLLELQEEYKQYYISFYLLGYRASAYRLSKEMKPDCIEQLKYDYILNNQLNSDTILIQKTISSYGITQKKE